jgi:hypothetical protein
LAQGVNQQINDMKGVSLETRYFHIFSGFQTRKKKVSTVSTENLPPISGAAKDQKLKKIGVAV